MAATSRTPERIGLIAGNGDFPGLFARAARAQGLQVFAVAMRGETREALRAEVDGMAWFRVGQLGGMIAALRRFGVQHAAMAGGIDKRRLFQTARPDWLGLQLLWRMSRRRDDGLLRGIAGLFEARGIRIVDSTLYMPDALAPAGVLTRKQPSAQQQRDFAYGLEVARALGALDIGQTVVVRDGAVVAMEAIEGTDACIARGGALCNGQNATVVKVAKPLQDMRFDVPSIGPVTMATLHQAGVRALGIEAGRTLMLDPQACIEAADRLGICVVGLGASARPPA